MVGLYPVPKSGTGLKTPAGRLTAWPIWRHWIGMSGAGQNSAELWEGGSSSSHLSPMDLQECQRSMSRTPLSERRKCAETECSYLATETLRREESEKRVWEIT